MTQGTDVAETKYRWAFAGDVAAVLRNAAVPATVAYDRDAQTWTVQVNTGQARYDMAVPASGAMFGLWRGSSWCGGIGHRLGKASPAQVATAMLARIFETTRSYG